jgi:hypothetical protein
VRSSVSADPYRLAQRVCDFPPNKRLKQKEVPKTSLKRTCKKKGIYFPPNKRPPVATAEVARWLNVHFGVPEACVSVKRFFPSPRGGAPAGGAPGGAVEGASQSQQEVSNGLGASVLHSLLPAADGIQVGAIFIPFFSSPEAPTSGKVAVVAAAGASPGTSFNEGALVGPNTCDDSCQVLDPMKEEASQLRVVRQHATVPDAARALCLHSACDPAAELWVDRAQLPPAGLLPVTSPLTSECMGAVAPRPISSPRHGAVVDSAECVPSLEEAAFHFSRSPHGFQVELARALRPTRSSTLLKIAELQSLSSLTSSPSQHCDQPSQLAQQITLSVEKSSLEGWWIIKSFSHYC